MIAYGRLIHGIMERFENYRGPNGEHFASHLLKELTMGKLSDAWAAEIQAKANLQGSLDAANAAIDKFKTPNGYVLDNADLATVDTIIGPIAAPQVAAPPA